MYFLLKTNISNPPSVLVSINSQRSLPRRLSTNWSWAAGCFGSRGFPYSLGNSFFINSGLNIPWSFWLASSGLEVVGEFLLLTTLTWITLYSHRTSWAFSDIFRFFSEKTTRELRACCKFSYRSLLRKLTGFTVLRISRRDKAYKYQINLRENNIYISLLIVPTKARSEDQLGRIVLITNELYLASITLPDLFLAPKRYLGAFISWWTPARNHQLSICNRCTDIDWNSCCFLQTKISNSYVVEGSYRGVTPSI